jgi:hypothetical protein
MLLRHFLYNFGYEKTRGYSLTKVIADGPTDNTLEALKAWEAKVIHWWPVYRMAGGKPLLGLYRRRVAELLTFLHLPSDVAWTLPHMGVNLDELVANMRAGKPLVSEPKLAPPVGTPFIPPMPPEAPPAPEPIVVLEVPAHTEEISMSAPEAKPALKSKTIWGVLVLVMAPFVAQIGDALQVAGCDRAVSRGRCGGRCRKCDDVYRGDPGHHWPHGRCSAPEVIWAELLEKLVPGPLRHQHRPACLAKRQQGR